MNKRHPIGSGIAGVTTDEREATATPDTGPAPAPGSAARAAAELVTNSRRRITAGHRAAVDQLPPHLRHMAGYHIGWWDEQGRPTDTAGKALRPTLALTCADAVAGRDMVGGTAIAAAIAVELVHDFTLIHDDVMDGDRLRRGRPTVWSVFGRGQAILVGDAMLTLATSLIADMPGSGPMLGALTRSALELYAGQSADLAFEQRMDVTLPQALGMAEGKTGALLGTACELGALAAGADVAEAGIYRAFGRHLGIAFQLVDDVLGIWGTSESTGKPQGSDLYARKKSLPVVAALASGTASGRRLRQRYESATPFDPAAVLEIADLIERAGARAWASAEARRRHDLAVSLLDRTSAHPAGLAELRTVAAALVERDR